MKLLIFVNKSFKIIILFIISFFGLYIAFKGEDITNIYDQLINLDLFKILIALLLLILSCLIRAYRWHILLLPFANISFHKVFSATMIGYFGNGVLAFRLGEVLKANAVAKGNDINTSHAFGTVILERLLDVIVLLIILLIIIPWFPFEDRYVSLAVSIFSFSISVTVGLIYIFYKKKFFKKLEHLKIFSYSFSKKIILLIKKIFQGLTIITETKNIYSIFISSIIIWLIYFIVTFITLKACGIYLDIFETCVLLVLGSIAIGIPALPGSAGTYDAGIKYSLIIIFQVESIKALNYAIVSHAISYFPLLIIGFIYFIYSNVSFADLKEGQRR